MNLLLDTHIFLWYVSADPKLPKEVRDAIQDPGNAVYLSVVSVWEAEIKFSIGKLPLPVPAATYIPRQREAHGISSLSIEEPAVLSLSTLPKLHRDPFDRMLIAQAVHHHLTLVTLDAAVRANPADRLPK